MNEKVAALLRQIADILDYQNVAFKPIAYRRAAQTVEDTSRDVATMSVEELRELPGIGEAIALKIHEFTTTGDLKFLHELNAQIGNESLELLQVEDLGPKRIAQLQSKLGIRTVADLIAAAKAGKLRELPRFSELMEQKILANAGRVTERNRRFPLAEIQPAVESLIKNICAIPGIKRVEVAGSYRRKKETVGDIDIVAAYNGQRREGEALEGVTKPLADALIKLPDVAKVVAFGDTKVSFDLQSGLRVDVRFVALSQWGSALLYFTGSKEHNIALRKLAIDRGWKLNEYGLFEDEKVVASKEEEDIYKALGLPYIEPTKRVGELPFGNPKSEETRNN